MVLRIHS